MSSAADSVEFVEDLKHGIASVLDDAQERILIVCPYVRLDDVDRLSSRLVSRLEAGVESTLIIRDERKQREEALGSFRDKLRERGLNFLAVKNLHAKLYMSESRVIVSSVNLLETSFQHGLEVGLSVPQGPLYARVLDFIDLKLIDAANVVFGAKPNVKKAPVRPGAQRPRPLRIAANHGAGSAGKARAAPEAVTTTRGHCIRCATEIPMGLNRPFCAKDLKTWSRYADADYPEIFCLVCGQEKATSKAKPMCRTCYRRAAATG